MNTKTLTIIALFSALSIVLSLSPLKFPAPYAPYLKYQFWEIAIVIVFLLYGVKAGIITSVINALILVVFFPGDSPLGPLYNFIAILSMLLGIYILQRSLGNSSNGRAIIPTALATVFGMITRVAVMSIVNWIVLPHPLPVGYSVPPAILAETVAAVAFFNATIALYTIPLAYIIARFIVGAMIIDTKTQIWQKPESV